MMFGVFVESNNMEYLGVFKTLLLVVILPLAVNCIFEWVVKPFFNNAPARRDHKRNEKIKYYHQLNGRSDMQLLIEYISCAANLLIWVSGIMGMLMLLSIYTLRNSVAKSIAIFDYDVFVFTLNDAMMTIIFVSAFIMQRYIVKYNNKMLFLYKYVMDKEALLVDLEK